MMAAKTDHAQLAEGILERVGGAENVDSAFHCATRLRMHLKDSTAADQQAVGELPGVLTVVEAGGQFQVVIGDEVGKVHQALVRHLPEGASQKQEQEPDSAGEKRNLFEQFIQMISAIITPIIWPLAGAGLFKAFLVLFTTLGLLDPEGTTHLILDAASDAIFYFLPLFLAVTAAKRFGADQFIAMAIAGALVYPNLVEAQQAGESVTFSGIPVVLMDYSASVIPILVATWLLGHLERLLDKILHSSIRNFTKPLIALLVMVPLILMTVGPITTFAAQGMAGGITWLFDVAPWLGGMIMGGIWQILVIFGLHWGFVPIFLSDLGSVGHVVMLAPLMPAVLAQGAATLAVFLRTRSAARRQVAGSASLSGLLAGVTEPSIYGVNLPLKKPLYFGVVGGAIGGAISALGGSASTSFVFPSFLAFPAFLEVGSFTLLVVGVAVAMVISFTLTYFWVDREADPSESAASVTGPPVDQPAPQPQRSSVVTGGSPAVGSGSSGAGRVRSAEPGVVEIHAPFLGRLIELSSVGDKAFASGALGDGVGIVPESDGVVSPVEGTVVSVASSGHAYGIKTAEGVEILIHIGIDTVQLKGLHFSPAVSQGDHVDIGQQLAAVDFDAVSEAGYDITTVLTVTNSDSLTGVVAEGAGEAVPGAVIITVTP